MKHKSAGLLLCLLGALVLPRPAVAAAGGKTAFAILEMTEGARPAGMGEAYTGVADDVHGMYWNPAGLGKIHRQEISTSYLSYIVDISAGSVSYALPAWGGGLGLSALYLNYGQLVDDTAEIYPGSGQVYYWPYDLVGSLSYGRRIADGVCAGMSLKGIYENIRGYSAQGFAVDAGAMYEIRTLIPVSVGAAVKNIGIQTKAFIDEKSSLPLALHLGVGCKLFSETLTLAADAACQPVYGDVNFNLGGEYRWQNFISLRTGYKTAARDLKSGSGGDVLTGFCFGLGMHLRGYDFDYAFVPFSNLGNVHRVSLSLKWGESRIVPKQPSVSKPEPAKSGKSRPGRLKQKNIRSKKTSYQKKTQKQTKADQSRSKTKNVQQKKSKGKKNSPKSKKKKSRKKKTSGF